MPVSKTYEEFLHERLGELGRYTFKRMFGGLGVYHSDVIFAVVDNDQLFFRVAQTDVVHFEALGMGPFSPMPGKAPMKSYYQVPEEILNDRTELPAWIKRAIAAAVAAKSAKSASPKKSAKTARKPTSSRSLSLPPSQKPSRRKSTK